MDQREQRLRIPRLEQQPVLKVPLAVGIEEIVVPDLGGLETVRGRVFPQVPGQGLEDQADGGQALLAIIDQIGRPVGVEGIDGGQVHHRAEEVFAHVGAIAGVEDVLPELAAFPLRPGLQVDMLPAQLLDLRKPATGQHQEPDPLLLARDLLLVLNGIDDSGNSCMGKTEEEDALT